MQRNLNQGSEGFLAIRLFFLECKLNKESCTFKENFKDFVSGNADVSNRGVFFLSTLVVLKHHWFCIVSSGEEESIMRQSELPPATQSCWILMTYSNSECISAYSSLSLEEM